MKVTGPVTLEWHELLMAGFAGVMRQVENMKLGREGAHGIEKGDKGDWQTNIEGVLGEMVVSKLLDVYWKGKGTFRGADVGRDFQVRMTGYENGCLLLHKTDDDAKIFFLVTGSGRDYNVCGWLRAGDGKRPEYWTESEKQRGRPAFFVPQRVLFKEWAI